jgi:nucleotide-binding universal stress UspA family protein
MFATIIVGVDAREGGRDALALAARLAPSFDSGLIAVHAYPYDWFITRGVDGDFDSAMHAAAQETLDTELERAGVAAEAVAVADSSPGRALHRAAERHGADLIVVGSAHRGPVGRVLAGDVTAGTLQGAPCPVLVAPRGYAEHGGELGVIGVGFDDSPEARAALELAHELAKATGARLRVIDVVEPTVVGGAFPGYGFDWTEDADARRELAEERLAEVLAEVGDIATGDVMFGNAAQALVDEAEHLDLLVTGSRGYGPIRRLMLGSTSARLVRHAPCPVLVLTRHADEERANAQRAAAAARTS